MLICFLFGIEFWDYNTVPVIRVPRVIGADSIPIGIKLRTGQKKEKGTSYAQNKQQGG